MKACVSCDSSSEEVVKLSPQTVGLLAVLALSGSVALLSLGKQKLWHHLAHPLTSTPVGDECGTKEGLPREVPSTSTKAESCDSCGTPHVPASCMCGSPVLPVSALSGKKAQVVPKKVRFAPDVIDPAGDGREYRCKIKAPCQNPGPCMPEHCQSVREDDAPGSSAGSGAASKASQDRKMHTLAKPKLPANRMALYNGMRQYRSLMTIRSHMKY